MERSYKKLIIAAVLITMFSCFLIINRGHFDETANIFSSKKGIIENSSNFIDYAFGNKIPLDDIFYAAQDEKNNRYIITNKAKSIIKVNSESRRTLTIEIPEDEVQRQYFSNVVVDQSDNIYVIKTTLDQIGIYVENQEIDKYDSKGRFVSKLYDISYKSGEKNMRIGQIKRLEVREDSLYFYSVQDDKAEIYSIDLKDNKKLQKLYTINPKTNLNLYDVSLISNSSLYAITRNGEIYKFDLSGNGDYINYSKNKLIKNDFMPFSIQVYEDQIYVLDYFTNGILKFNNRDINEKTQVITNMKDTEYKSDFDTRFNELVKFNISKDGNIIAYNYNKIFFINKEGKIVDTVTNIKRPIKDVIGLWFFWIIFILFIITILETIWLIYSEFMEKRVPLILKEILIFTPVFLVMISILIGRIYERTNKEFYDQLQTKLITIAKSGVKFIDGDSLERLNSPEDFMNKDYLDTIKNIRYAYTASQNESDGNFNVIFRMKDYNAYFVLDDDSSTSYYRPADMSFGSEKVLYDNMMKGEKYYYSESSDSFGEWVNVKVPIYNSKGIVVGMYEVGIDHKGFDKQQMEILQKNLWDIIIFGMVIMFAFILITIYVLRYIRVLKAGVDEIAAGNMEVVVNVNSSDEISSLCVGFNTMAEYIRNFVAKITRMNETYHYFVPEQFLKLLGKKDLFEIKIGDNIKKNMGLMYSKLRTVQVLSKNAEENFSFINTYLSNFGPVIRNNNGIIEKYLGVDISAIFPERTNDAVHSAIDICNKLKEYNSRREKKGEQTIEIGIGIYHDSLMLGIIGEVKRLEGTVISDNGNICSMLSELSEKVSSQILVTENTINMYEGNLDFKYRNMGSIYLESKNKIIEIYDIYESDSDIMVELKDETKIIFEQGIELYKRKSFYEGREKFVEVIKKNSFDEAAKLYFYLCDEYCRKGITDNWNPAINYKE